MIRYWVKYSHTLAGTYRSPSVPQVFQTSSPIVYLGRANHEGTLEGYNLCKRLFLCHLNNISIPSMRSMQPKAHDPEQKSLLKSCLAFCLSSRLDLILFEVLT